MQVKNAWRLHFFERRPQAIEFLSRFRVGALGAPTAENPESAEIDLLAVKICQKYLSPLKRLDPKGGISRRHPASKQKCLPSVTDFEAT
jgi:hypothetical protein